uniref:Thioredoxin-like fold domain-containing protein n=1 Tax=Parastrongyloides trichosuri TaxID=131310 RepID=A0A0N4Z0B6_PARTI
MTGEAPSSMPPDHFIQTSFIFRNLNNNDMEFSKNIIEIMNKLRPRLLRNGKVTVDNENINCNEQGYVKCDEYPKKASFHFLIIEDSSHGAAIYTIPRTLNRNVGQIEAAILDALSRHSLFSLMSFISKEHEMELGFIKELSNEELLEMIKDNEDGNDNNYKKIKEIKKSKKKNPIKIFTRGPFELDLLDEKILEFRDIQEPSGFGSLIKWDGESLNKAIEDNDIIFVMFWSKTNMISMHSISLWIDASDKLKNIILSDVRKIKIGFVSCHEEPETCQLYGIGKKNEHYIYMYENGKVSLNMPNMRDGDFYVEWVQMLLDDPLIEVEDEDDIENVMNGYMVGFNGKRKAITLGIFNNRDSHEFNNFKQVALLLRGKYHFVWHENADTGNTVTVLRPYENDKDIMRLYNGNFEVESLIEFISYASLPTVIDLSNGFSNDIILKKNKVMIMIHNDDEEFKKEYISKVNEYVKWDTGKEIMFCYINYKKDNVPYGLMLAKFHITIEDLPQIFMYEDNKFRIKSYVNRKEIDIKEIIEMKEEEFDRRLLFPKHIVNPMRYLNLEKSNQIFGRQNVLLLADPVYEFDENDDDNEYDPHMFDKIDFAKMGGCPMAAYANRMREKELEKEMMKKEESKDEL